MSELVGFHDNEPHTPNIAGRLHWLRAGVLGANDGIVSVAATVVGVAGVTNSPTPILVAGIAALVGGAVSMALGEYVSVSSQRDSQRALIEKERRELAEDPEAELAELTEIYRTQGLSEATATQVALELTASAMADPRNVLGGTVRPRPDGNGECFHRRQLQNHLCTAPSSWRRPGTRGDLRNRHRPRRKRNHLDTPKTVQMLPRRIRLALLFPELVAGLLRPPLVECRAKG